MKDFLKRQVWPVVAGLLSAFVIMMLCEYVNSLIYPLPPDLVLADPDTVQAYTATLPWTVYILVFVGWILGSFKAGCVTTFLSKETSYRLSFVVGIILTILGAINNIILGHNIVFNIIGLPMFILFTYLGHKYLLRARIVRRV